MPSGLEKFLIGAGAEAVGAALLSIVGADLIKKLRVAGANLIAQGRDAGNALIVRLGNEMTAVSYNMSSVLGDELRKTVGEMDARLRPLMARIEALPGLVQDLIDQQYEFKDAAVLDVRALLNTLAPFLAESFFIQRVDGTAILPRPDATHLVKVLGTGLGYPSANIRSKVRLSISGNPTDLIARDVGTETTAIDVPNFFWSHSPQMTASRSFHLSLTSRRRSSCWADGNKPLTASRSPSPSIPAASAPSR